MEVSNDEERIVVLSPGMPQSSSFTPAVVGPTENCPLSAKAGMQERERSSSPTRTIRDIMHSSFVGVKFWRIVCGFHVG
jgi:hypothetical protein